MSVETAQEGARPGPLGRALDRLCRVFATTGGFILVALAAMTVISIIGRFALNSPIPGDFELVEIGGAVAVFAFLPYCQYVKGNVMVDFFTAKASRRTRALLEAAGNAVYTGIAAMIAWQMIYGAQDMYRYNEQTMVLGVPIWWGFPPILLSMALLVAVCAYTTWRSLQEARP